MHNFAPFTSLLGGTLIGLSASLVFLVQGRRAGISGLWAGLLRLDGRDRTFQGWFFAGLVAAGVGFSLVSPQVFGGPAGSLGLAAGAGLLVGYGTQLGGGCTSGHGVCGISRLEARSFIATVTFMLTGALAVLATRGLR